MKKFDRNKWTLFFKVNGRIVWYRLKFISVPILFKLSIRKFGIFGNETRFDLYGVVLKRASIFIN